MPSPPAVLAAMLAADPARPRVTCYDDLTSPPERVELSAKVLANWVAKAANCLVEEYDAGPGSRVLVDLPALHWRTLYWALAVWSVGAELVLPGPDAGSADVTVSVHDPAADVLVTLAALARAYPGGVPAGVTDEARELSSYGDAFVPDAPSGDGWVGQPGEQAGEQGVRLALAGDPAPADALRAVLSAWAGDGSVVLFRGTGADQLGSRCAAENVSAGPG